MRNKSLDMFRGILILLVVVGHYRNNMIKEIIFLFHMPLFFVLSGVLIKKEKMSEKSYFREKIKILMIPYLCYGLFDCLICRKSWCSILKLLWGGRFITGVYWYITCYLLAILIFAVLLIFFGEKIRIGMMLGGG